MNHPSNKLRFWADANRDVATWARARLAPTGAYYVARIEDFTLGDARFAVARLARFLRPNAARTPPATIAAAAAVFAGHAGSYGGAALAAKDRRSRLRSFGDTAAAELRLFGYRVGDYGVATSCNATELCGVVAAPRPKKAKTKQKANAKAADPRKPPTHEAEAPSKPAKKAKRPCSSLSARSRPAPGCA